ncbi:MAG: sugar phosphate nucleotidyltransferase [Anaerolineaceae bacterium]|nr:sugar phosphate nucleotidyltransferase [Anaerolineaceae bacterium]
MKPHYYAVIMAGGGGTRLWPLSRQKRPKQVLKLFDQRTLFEIAIDRLEGVFPLQRILVVTVADQAAQLMQLCPQIPQENYLIEPMPRGTAAVVGLAGVALRNRDPQAVMAILTADHFIGDEARFRDLLSSAYQLAESGFLVTLGITPSFASTGYGYIQRGEPLGEYEGMRAYRVLRFKEKPSEAQAAQMLASGDHDWNSGMFIWRVDRILQEFHRQMPELAGQLEEISQGWESPARQEVVRHVWPSLKSETIDYGIMERAEQVAVLPATNLGWNDVGSWDSLFDVLSSDGDGNIILGSDYLGIDTKNSLVSSSGSERLIVTIGVRDLVVIDTGDALLICHKDQAQQVKQVVTLLKEANRRQYL